MGKGFARKEAGALAAAALLLAGCGREAPEAPRPPTLNAPRPVHFSAAEGEAGKAVKYDDAEWHYGAGNFPLDEPESHGFTHIGFYLTWAAERGLLSDLVRGESEGALKRVLAHTQSPIFLLEIWDGALVDDMLSEEGNAFTSAYYGDQTPGYLVDYASTFPGDGDAYRVDPSWENYARLKPVLDRRFDEWRAKRQEEESD